MKRLRLSLWGCVCAIFLVPVLTSGQTSRVDWSTFDAGFSESGAGTLLLRSAPGQPFAGSTKGSSSAIESGFLADTGLVVFPTLGIREIPGKVPSAYSIR